MLPRFTVERTRCRRGAASVEFAVCLPVIVLIVFGAIEACSFVFLQQSVQRSAYEAARVAASPYRQLQDGQSAGLQVLDQFGLHGGTVTISTSQLPGYPGIDLVDAAVTLPIAENRVMPAWVLAGSQLSARCSMVREKRQ
ncbi:MAG: pilus assembly protein [Pirellulaceae bacterium]|nr:pilus assembly protein [Pirellulaceae bacterium]